MIHHNCPQCYTEHQFELKTKSKHICSNCNNEMLTGFSKQNVFLTYSDDHNYQVVEKIKLDMEARGHEVFIDKENVTDTPTWKEKLHSELKEKSVVSFLSEQAVSNPGDCLDQIGVALGAKGGHIQTILLEKETKVSPPPSVSHVQWLNMSDWQDKLDTDNLWYGNKILELLNVIESSENVNFAGEIKKLNEYLRPIISSQRINQLISQPFIGRQWVFDAIEQWRTADDNKRIFWLSGLPGVGKSAVSAQLAHYCKDKVAAVHFCDYSNSEHRIAARVIRSICYQLCTRIPEFRKKILFIPEVFDHRIDKMDSSELFECIIINPLSLLIDSGRDRSLIVIDALDEATENKRNKLVDILAKYADRIPQWIRFLVTGRPEKELTGSLKDMEYNLLDISSKQNKADLEAYIHLKLPKQLAQCKDGQNAITNLIEKSEGIFLYIVQVCEEILQGHFCLTEPDKFPIGLDGLYYAFFLRLTGQVDKCKEEVDTMVYHEKYHTQLSMVMAAIEDLPTSIIKESCNWSDEQLNRFLLQIRTLFPTGTAADGETIHPFHKTIVDWIGNAERAKQFVVDKDLGHQTIINNIEPKFENKEPLSVYGQRNLPAHFLALKQWQKIIDVHRAKWEWKNSWFDDAYLELLLQLHEQFKKKNTQWEAIDIYNNVGRIYTEELNFNQKLKIAEYAYSIINNISDDNNIEHYLPHKGLACYNYGCICQYLLMFNKASIAYREALRTYNFINKRNPDAYLLIVARILNNLAAVYHKLHLYSNAETEYKEALKTYRALIANKMDGLFPELARTLNNLANLHRNQRQYNKAESEFKEILKIFRTLVANKMDGFLPDVARTLGDLANLHQDQRQYNCAETKYLEALKIRRVLAEKNPDVFLPDVAGTLNNLANLHQDQRQYNRAETEYLEAIKIRRVLVEKNPDVFLPVFADTLNNLANSHNEQKSYDIAEEEFKEALKIRRELAEKNPDIFLPDVAHTLNGLAIIHKYQKLYDDAENEFKEVLKIRRDLVADNHDDYLPDVAMTLNNIAILHHEQQHYNEAKSKYKEALRIFGELAKLNPNGYLPDIAMTLSNIAALYYNNKMYENSEDKYKEALRIYRELAELNPDGYLVEVASTLHSIATLHNDQNRHSNAEMEFKEALKILRYLAEKKPDVYFPEVAKTLNNLAILHNNQQQYHIAEKNYQEALKILRVLAEKKPDDYLPCLANTIYDLAYVHNSQKSYDKAEMEYMEAIKIKRDLAEKSPTTYLPEVAKTLNNLANLYSRQKCYDKAEEEYKEVLRIYRDLAKDNLSVYLSDIINTLNNYGLSLEHAQKREIQIKCFYELYSIYSNLIDIQNIKHFHSERKELLKKIIWTHMLTGEFEKSKDAANKYFGLNDGVDIQLTKVAHALLFMGKYKEAENIYLKNKDIKISEDDKTLGDVMLEELDELEQNGVTHPDVDKIRELLNKHSSSGIFYKTTKDNQSGEHTSKVKLGFSIIEDINSCRNEGVQSRYKLSDVEEIISLVHKSDGDNALKLILRLNLLKAEIALETEEYKKVLEFCNQGETAFNNLKEKDQISESVGSLYSIFGDVYFKVQNDLPKALGYYLKSETIFKELLVDNYEINAPILAAIQSDMAKIYQKQNMGLDALERLENILEIRLELYKIKNDLLYNIGVGNALEAIATLSLSMKNYKMGY